METNNNVIELAERNDRTIANKLFYVRNKLGISREELAKSVKIDLLELENYEQAIDPIPASMLMLISMKLGISINYFYDDEELDDNNSNNDNKENHVLIYNALNNNKRFEAF